MPLAKKPSASSSSSTTSAPGGGDGRTTGQVKGYKPAWIKEAAEPNKETETPWGIMKKRDAVNDPEEVKRKAAADAAKRKAADGATDEDIGANFAKPQLRKVSLKASPENGDGGGGGGKEPSTTFLKPALKTVKTREAKPIVREESRTKIEMPKLNSVKVEKMKELPPPPKKEQPDYRTVLKKVATRDRIDEEKKKGAPAAPPLPPPPPLMPKMMVDTAPLSAKQKSTLDNLRSRPKARPDWTQVLKGIEGGAKLKHVETNDRSRPLLPRAKAKGQFLYESERENAHNTLLKEIQQGVKLKGVKTDDRSRPNLEGLRKFRRQMTIEEQIQKSVSMASMVAPPPGIQPTASMASVVEDETADTSAPPLDLELDLDDLDDDLDDIDRVRDDLQSTKQLLAIEMRNKEACARENRRLQSRIQNMEKDIDENRTIARNEQEAERRREPDEKLIVTLKAEAAEARKKNEQLEAAMTSAANDLDAAKCELDELRTRNAELEKRLQEFMAGKRHSMAGGGGAAGEIGDEDEEHDGATIGSDEEDESDEKKARRALRELKALVAQLRAFKTKVDNAKKERVALQQIVRTHSAAIRDEKRKYKQLQKEVDKMAALMKESDEEEEEEDEEEDENEISESESSSSSSAGDESESERSQSEPEDAPVERKKENVVARARRHENRLGALKKTNFMLKTNAERLQDELTHQKVMTASLQSDLDSVLSDLG